MTTFLDTNIVIAISDPSDAHHQWSVDEYNKRKLLGPLIVSDIVYCESGVGMPHQAALDAIITQFGLTRFPSKDEALFRAGEAYLKYRKSKGEGKKTGVLPDFIVGAVAEIENIPLMTAERARYPHYFPNLKLITP